MILQKLKPLVLLSIPLFALHALEEYSYNFYLLDPSFKWIGDSVGYSPQTIFLIEQVLITIFLLVTFYKPRKFFLIIVGLILIFEISHPIIALASHQYAGLLTSIPLIVLGTVYWKHFLSRE